jgi:hypothetical protein
MTKPVPTDSASITSVLNQDFRLVAEGVQHIVDNFNAVVNHVNDNRGILGPLILWIKNQLEHVKAFLVKVIELVKYAIEHATPVLSLVLQSFDWVAKVKTPMSDLSAPAGTPRDQNLAYWTGGAATTYTNKAIAQKGAIDDVTIKADFVSQWLFFIAQANVDYMVGLVTVVASVVGKLVQAAIDAATVVDIPWAIDQLSKQVGDLVTAAINDLTTTAKRFLQSVKDARDIQSQVGDHTKLPGGKWPQAVAH